MRWVGKKLLSESSFRAILNIIVLYERNVSPRPRPFELCCKLDRRIAVFFSAPHELIAIFAKYAVCPITLLCFKEVFVEFVLGLQIRPPETRTDRKSTRLNSSHG